jgi:osmotically-inducible protein OsmY
MELRKVILAALILATGFTSGCSSTPAKSPDVSGSIRQSLSAAGLKNVSVSQDRDKGVVTLSGHVAADAEKAQAQSVATSLAQGQVVANEIAIVAPGVEKDAREINSDVDKGIEKNLEAALIQNGLQKAVHFQVKNGVITLTGEVNSDSLRNEAAQIAAAVPYQQQIVNELQIRNLKATSYP